MTLIYLHIGFMATATLLIVAGVVIARYFRQWKPWMKVHRALNATGAALGLAGFVMSFSFVRSSGGPHLRVPHGYLGILAILLLLIAPTAGGLLTKTRSKSRLAFLRKLHRWSGRAALLAIGAAATAGISLFR